jgi:hypothetical protein
MRRLQCVVALVGVACVGALGCSSSGKSAQSTSTTAKSYQVTTADGQVTVSLDGHLPPGWPSAFPVPPGAKPAGSGSVQGKTDGVTVGVFTATGSPQDAFTFYKSNSQLTVDSSSSVGASQAFVGTIKISGTYDGRVTIAAIGDTNGVVVVLNTAGSSSSSGGSSTSTSTG